MNIIRSIGLIGEKGSSLEKARINCILNGGKAEQDVIHGLIQFQNADGGFPFGLQKGNLSTINVTAVALWWMEFGIAWEVYIKRSWRLIPLVY